MINLLYFITSIAIKQVNLTVETLELSLKSQNVRKFTIRGRICIFTFFFINSKLYAITFFHKFSDLNGCHSVIPRVFFYKKMKKNLQMYSDKHF